MAAFGNGSVKLYIHLRRFRAVDLKLIHLCNNALQIADILGGGTLNGQAGNLRLNQHTGFKKIMDQILLICEMQTQRIFSDSRPGTDEGSASLADNHDILCAEELHRFPQGRPAYAE